MCFRHHTSFKTGLRILRLQRSNALGISGISERQVRRRVLKPAQRTIRFVEQTRQRLLLLRLFLTVAGDCAEAGFQAQSNFRQANRLYENATHLCLRNFLFASRALFFRQHCRNGDLRRFTQPANFSIGVNDSITNGFAHQ